MTCPLCIDFTPNADHIYVFTNETNELPIATQLRGDRSGESIESFTICLPATNMYSPQIAQGVAPSCVTVMIIDDDCKYPNLPLHSTYFSHSSVQLC